MTTELERDGYSRITHDPAAARIELEWFDSTAAMTDADFRRSLERLAELGVDYRPRHVVGAEFPTGWFASREALEEWLGRA